MKIHALLCPSSKTAIIEHHNSSTNESINPNYKNLFETLPFHHKNSSYFQHFRIKPKISEISNQGLMLLAQAACTRALLSSSSNNNNNSNSNQDNHHQSKSISKNVYYSGSEDGIKPKRKRADMSQLSILRHAFQQSPFPSTEFRGRLAKMLGMTCRSVQIWFQNQRQMFRHNVQSVMTKKTPSEISFSPKTSPITVLTLEENTNDMLSWDLQSCNNEIKLAVNANK